MTTTASTKVALASLHTAPPVGLVNRRWCVKLADNWEPVGHVRQVLRENPALVRQLQERRVPLDWITLPDVSPQEMERLPDAATLEASLEEIDQRSSDAAAVVLARLRQKAKDAGVSLPHTKRESLSERVISILAGVTQALEADLPYAARKSGQAAFQVTKTEGRWEGANGEGIDLRWLIRHVAGQVGSFNKGAADLLAEVVLAQLAAGTSPLPDLAIERTTDGFRLCWSRPTIGEPEAPAELRAFQVLLALWYAAARFNQVVRDHYRRRLLVAANYPLAAAGGAELAAADWRRPFGLIYTEVTGTRPVRWGLPALPAGECYVHPLTAGDSTATGVVIATAGAVFVDATRFPADGLPHLYLIADTPDLSGVATERCELAIIKRPTAPPTDLAADARTLAANGFFAETWEEAATSVTDETDLCYFLLLDVFVGMQERLATAEATGLVINLPVAVRIALIENRIDDIKTALRRRLVAEGEHRP